MQKQSSNVCDEILVSLREAVQSSGAEFPSNHSLSRPEEHIADFSSNVAFVLAKQLRRKPLEVAEEIAGKFRGPAKIAAAAPGFINFTVSEERLLQNLQDVSRDDWGHNRSGYKNEKPVRVNVEYCSANPTGPLHVGHGRGAVLGDAISRLLAISGYSVTREYYLNDVGKQIELLGESVLHFVHRSKAENPYKLTYGGAVLEEVAAGYTGAPDDPAAASQYALEKLFDRILDDLRRLEVTFDSTVRESSLASKIPGLIDEMKKRGLLYEAAEPEGAEPQKRRAESKAAVHKDKMEGGTFLRTSRFGDEIDRIILRANGAPTYFTSDVLYHEEKFTRGFERAINVWGADHGGHVKRMKAALTGLGLPADALDVVLVQIVRLIKGGVEVKMSKRSGEVVALSELIDEVGPDAARFFFLMRSPNSQLDFDLDLAVKQSADNPVFYCQYAHARTCRLLEKGREAGIVIAPPSPGVLVHPAEIEILRKLARLPESIRAVVDRLDVHRIPELAIELAQSLHRYQTAGKQDDALRIIVSDRPDLSGARLFMIERVGMALRFLFGLMGVRAPERM